MLKAAVATFDCPLSHRLPMLEEFFDGLAEALGRPKVAARYTQSQPRVGGQ